MRGGRRPNNKKSPRKRGKNCVTDSAGKEQKTQRENGPRTQTSRSFLFLFFVLSPADVSRAPSIRGNGEWRYRVRAVESEGGHFRFHQRVWTEWPHGLLPNKKRISVQKLQFPELRSGQISQNFFLSLPPNCFLFFYLPLLQTKKKFTFAHACTLHTQCTVQLKQRQRYFHQSNLRPTLRNLLSSPSLLLPFSKVRFLWEIPFPLSLFPLSPSFPLLLSRT